MADARRLVELGMVPPLAKEVAAQITSGIGSARRLAELSMVPVLAGELASQINAKVGNARRLAELGMVPVLAKEVAAQVSSGGVKDIVVTTRGETASNTIGTARTSANVKQRFRKQIFAGQGGIKAGTLKIVLGAYGVPDSGGETGTGAYPAEAHF